MTFRRSGFCERKGLRPLARAHALFVAALLSVVMLPMAIAEADSSSPLLAAYYDRQMAIVDGIVYAWRGDSAPKRIAVDAVQVGVGRSTFYALTRSGELRAYRDASEAHETVLTGITRFAAGRSGILAIKTDGTLWWIAASGGNPVKIAADVASAAVGDSANYYITRSGALFVKGKAHRGQYGDGRLQTTDRFIQTASDVTQISAHTGHAILLKGNGDVMGTGGNIYGPVGKHGLGDKAVRWSRIMTGASGIATGSSHTMAIRLDGTLAAWGREYGPEPATVMDGVAAVAAGSSTSIALKRDGTLWQWKRGSEPRAISLK